jgi:hypothetical protein
MNPDRMGSGEERTRRGVRIPADVEREDRLLGSLTARQLAILSVAGVVVWVAYIATRHVVPLFAFGMFAFPFGAIAALLALGRADGLSGDRLAVAAWRHLRTPRRLVPSADGVPGVPSLIEIDAGPSPAPLRLPFAGVRADGIVDLGADGWCVLCRASSVTFSLRTSVEQEALVAGYARWLNSLTEPVELLVRAEPVDLAPMIESLLIAAPGLPHPGLEAGAREHAAFLSDLGASRTLLRREVLVVLRQPSGEGATERLCRRAEEATSALAAAGVVLTVLDEQEANACLLRALDPARPPRPAGMGAPDAVVTTGGSR